MNDNKLIAEFMGMNPHHQDSGCLTRLDDNGSNEVVPIEELAYHTSWDWLMPVVGKISRDITFLDNEYRESLLDVVPYGHIQDVLDAVVEFIKEHNKIK